MSHLETPEKDRAAGGRGGGGAFPQRRASRGAGSVARSPPEQCLEAWCLISDEMSIIRSSAGESGAEQI